MKTKQQLIEQAADLARKHQEKKDVIEKLLNDTDKEKEISGKHLYTIATVNEILKEMTLLEIEYKKITEEVKK